MKLTIERAALLRSLAHVQSVVERRNTIPILSNVLLEAKEERLRLTATDMDLTIHEETEAQIQSPGATTVPAHTFYDIIRKLPDGSEVELSISDGGGQMRLRAGRSNFVLSTLPREDFPAAAASELPYRFTLQAQETRDLIDRTRFAVSTEETRYYLNGIYLHVGAHDSGEVLRAVATDGHRLARVEVALPDGAAGMPGIILPRKMVNELRKLVDDYDEELQVALSEARVCFTFGAIVLSSKLIDGTFPDYERVIPANNDKIMTVDCSLFAEAVDRVSTISTEKSRAVKMTVNSDRLTLLASSPEAGSADEEIPIHYDGAALEIGFNSRYLLDIAQQIQGETAEFAMADAASPTLVRDGADTSALYVLMPMRV